MLAEHPAPLSPAELALVRLTDRQRAVLCLVAEGCTDREAGATLGLARITVQHLVREVRDLLGARNRAHAAAIGVRLGLVGDTDGAP